ncbi:RluA family pseudouridine synthase [Candidatus Woesebacteria bacterium]|nr:RluA family pseudouridine synthase [Candidatus Woesebacteria bacterium]
MEPKIIYEDTSLLVLDKPAGVIVNEALTTKNQPVLQSWLAKRDYPLAKSREERGGIVHRLDKETSGIIIVAKTKNVFTALQRQFKERKVKKTYLALVHGALNKKVGEIEVPVGRLPWRRERFGVLAGGRSSKSTYEVVAQYLREGERFSLVEVSPQTGRTHQIRIHFKYLGHPVVSDEFYAGRKTARADRKWCPRLFLHAKAIEFFHPERGQKVKFSSGLSDDLVAALTTLEKLRETN